MRSGLSLRIPGQQELSPDNKTLKVHSASSSLIKTPCSKPPSPILSTYHHRSTKSSAYNRIHSNTSIKKQVLPSFLQLSQPSSINLSNQIIKLHPKKLQTTDITTDTSCMKTEEQKEIPKKLREKDPEKFIKKIFTKKLKGEEIVLKVGKIELTRGELQTLDPKHQICRSVIDACLRCIKYKNRKLCKQSELCERGFVFDTKMAQLIFTTDNQGMVFSRNPLKYEYLLFRLLIFPLFVEYWTLVLLDSKQKRLSIYNIQNQDIAQEILECVKGFVEAQLKKHERKALEATAWRELNYNLVQFPVPDVDSGTLLLYLSYKYCLTPNVPLSCEFFVDFRYTLLVMLYRHGIVVN